MAYNRDAFSSDAFDSDAFDGLATPAAQTWNAWGRAWGKSWGKAWGPLLEAPYFDLSGRQHVYVRHVLQSVYALDVVEKIIAVADRNNLSAIDSVEVIRAQTGDQSLFILPRRTVADFTVALSAVKNAIVHTTINAAVAGDSTAPPTTVFDSDHVVTYVTVEKPSSVSKATGIHEAISKTMSEWTTARADENNSATTQTSIIRATAVALQGASS